MKLLFAVAMKVPLCLEWNDKYCPNVLGAWTKKVAALHFPNRLR
jgi:hypothetical protein